MVGVILGAETEIAVAVCVEVGIKMGVDIAVEDEAAEGVISV